MVEDKIIPQSILASLSSSSRSSSLSWEIRPSPFNTWWARSLYILAILGLAAFIWRFFTNRNFRVVSADGRKVYGYGRSIWAMIDTETRQPTDSLAIDDGAINDWIVKDKECPIAKGGRVKMSNTAQLVRTIGTYYNDVDINGHINSVKYIEHVLDLWPMEWYRQHNIKRFEIAYVAEAHAGDQLSFYQEQPAEDSFNVRIVKTGDVEVARAAVAFNSRS